MHCRKTCKNFPTCRFTEEGERQKHCNFFVPLEANDTRGLSSGEAPGSATKPGLTEAETEEYGFLLTLHIGEVTQEDWQRFHALNEKYIETLRR